MIQKFYLHSDHSQDFGVASFVSENNDLFFIRLKGLRKERALLYSFFYCLKHINPMFPATIYTLEMSLYNQLASYKKKKQEMAYNTNTSNQDIWCQIHNNFPNLINQIELTYNINQDHNAMKKLKDICQKAL